MFLTHTKLISLMFCTNLFTFLLVSVFSFAKIIHPPNRCGISRSWLTVWSLHRCTLSWRLKGHSKLWLFVFIFLQYNSHRCLKLRERATGMLIAGMSTRAVARELTVHFSTISLLQRRFREFVSTSNWPHNHLDCATFAQYYFQNYSSSVNLFVARQPFSGLDIVFT